MDRRELGFQSIDVLAQRRDLALAGHLGRHDLLQDLEELEDHELDRMREAYEKLAEKAREKMRRGGTDTDVPEVDSNP